MAYLSKIDKEFAPLKPNFKLLNQLVKKQPKEYIRKRLKAIKGLWQGKSRQAQDDCKVV